MTPSQSPDPAAATAGAGVGAGRLRLPAGDPVTLAIATGAGIASFAMNFWIPFLPLYMLDIGATSDANALFWIGVAISGQGVARLVTGPIWGILSDRYGRRLMFIRALFFASITTVIAAFATAPWHVAVAFICQGIFSGFIPAAVALTSVSVPDERLPKSLGMVTGAQYLGNTVGPAVGSGLALAFGLRGAIVAAAIMPALSALLVLFVVPRDSLRRDEPDHPEGAPPPVERAFLRTVGFQFFLSLFIFFFLFGANQLVRLSMPISLSELSGNDNAEGLTGIAFTVAGVASVVGVMGISRQLPAGRLRATLIGGAILSALANLLLAASGAVALAIAAFAFISLVQAAVLPASNTLIAGSVPRHRRGTAFGYASSAQALAFMAGPSLAALFAASSLRGGYAMVGAAFVVLAGFLWLALREPGRDPRTAAA